MKSDEYFWHQSIANLERSRNYLQKNVESEPSYVNLINQLDSRIKNIQKSCKPIIKIVSFPNQMGLELQAIGESDGILRSLYDFRVFSQVNITQIVARCSIIFLIYSSHKQISNHQRKLINAAKKNNITLFILVSHNKSSDLISNSIEWFEAQKYSEIDRESILFNDFWDFNCREQITAYKQFLLERSPTIKQRLLRQCNDETLAEIRDFFAQTKKGNQQKINRIKQTSLQGRGIHHYRQQIINKTFNQIHKQQQQKILFLKQKINQSRSNYFNIFLPDSWLFQLQQTIEQSEIKLVKEEGKTYLYCAIEKDNSLEYFHSYILGLYQQQVIDTLKSQWHNLNYYYADGGFNSFIQQAKNQLTAINLLELSDLQLITIDFEREISPQLELSDFIDSYCLKINSRIVFDYNYLQSSWLKMSISAGIGTAIYLVTKLYFGTGKYIGFFILIFQIINIITGQNIKTLKLKQHKKELHRTLYNKYQNLVRLIVEQLINTLITSIDRQNQKYQQEFDRLAQLAQIKLDAIEEEIEELKSRKNRLESDRKKLISWFN